MSKKKPGVKFLVESDDGDSSPSVERRTAAKESLKKSKEDPKKASSKSLSKKSKPSSENLELMKFLKSEKRPIVQNPKRIDDEERELLEQIGKQAIDLDGLLKFKEPKAKDKLWKIPYTFKDDKGVIFPEGEPSTINRFGTGINDGCFVSLSLPVQIEKKKRGWDDINREADEALESFEMAKMSRLNRTRRGSILQPTHVYLTPNPETGHTEYIMAHNFLTMREWKSEFNLSTGESQELLGTEFKEHICENTSMDNLDNIPFADAGGGVPGSQGFGESEIKFMQAVQDRRRASLMPPKAGGNFSDMAFQRASFAGGALWSPNLERMRRKAIYHDKVKLINPDYIPPDETNNESDDEENDDEDYNDADNEQENGDENNRDSENDEEDDEDYAKPSAFKSLRKESFVAKKGSIQDKRRRNRNVKTGAEVEEQYYPQLNSGDRIRAKLFSHELTLIVRQHFVAIKESEIVNFITHSGQHVLNACPNIKALLHFQNRVIRLISTFILKHDELDERVDAILFFLETMRQLYLLGNWHSVNLIAQSLQCPPVVRLKETWRRITFQYQDDYCYFMEMSEHLRMGKECVEYETLTRFVPLFDDVLDKIREMCGLKLILIQQNRQQSDINWRNSNQNNNLVRFIHDEVEDLKESVQKESQVNGNAKPPKKSLPAKEKPSKVSFFKRFIFCAARPEQVSQRKESADPVEFFEPSRQQTDLIQLDENSNQQLLNSNNMTKMPSCKKFWSIADYNKLSPADKELIKQEIVRTLVAFQKTAFYVFEERDPELRDFLLNCRCESMDANMRRSREVENESTRNRMRNHDSQCTVSSANGISWAGSRGDIDHEEAEQFLESRHGSRRVMFAEDFDEVFESQPADKVSA